MPSTSSWRSSAAAASPPCWTRSAATASRASRCASSRRPTRVDRAPGPRSARRPGGRGPHLLRPQHDPAARQGLGVPPVLGLLDGLCRLVQPHPLRPGDRPRVERARVRRAQPRCRRQVRRRLRQLLGGRRLRSLRPDAVRGGAGPGRAPRRRAARHPQPDRAAAVSVPGAAPRAHRAVAPSTATTATSSWRRPVRARP